MNQLLLPQPCSTHLHDPHAYLVTMAGAPTVVTLLSCPGHTKED